MTVYYQIIYHVVRIV